MSLVMCAACVLVCVWWGRGVGVGEELGLNFDIYLNM